ncbi:hypothetical protein GCM10010468_39830 [Actinocorallia longicatena]|uniref:Uncharacterized protein n=1 Tax=Actinocorallia longicatena TaxID=111803 RepID=A0ABP6QBU1_9ACTN
MGALVLPDEALSEIEGEHGRIVRAEPAQLRQLVGRREAVQRRSACHIAKPSVMAMVAYPLPCIPSRPTSVFVAIGPNGRANRVWCIGPGEQTERDLTVRRPRPSEAPRNG